MAENDPWVLNSNTEEVNPWVAGSSSAPRPEQADPWVLDAEVAPVSAPQRVDLPSGPYTEDDLVKDEYFTPISNYVSDRFGADAVRSDDRRDIVEKYLNNMRGFSGGNTVRAVGEIRYISSLSKGDKKLATAGEAYKLFEGMSGLFSGETSISEKAEIVQDYTRSALLDPVNLLAGWVGKAVGGGSSKVAVLTANAVAKKAFEKKIAAGAVQKTALKAAEKAFLSTIASGEKKRAVSKVLLPRGLKAVTTRQGLREVAGSTAVDALAAVGTDVAYQTGLIKAGAQEDYSVFQTGIAALGGLTMGGIQAGRVAARGTQGVPLPDIQLKAKVVTPDSKVGTALHDTLKKMASFKRGEWLDKVARGKKLDEFSPDFWRTFVLGNDEEGIEGLAPILQKEGYWFVPKDDADNITNFLGDALAKQEAELKPFLDELNAITGGKKYTAKEFGDALSSQVHKSASLMNVESYASKILKEGMTPTIAKIVEEDLLDFKYGLLGKLGSEEVKRSQNNLIRLLVANPATTLRNIRGWGVASSLNSVTDLVQASLYGGYGLATGNKASMKKAAHLAAVQRTKFASLLDTDMSYEAFLSMTRLHPKLFNNLLHTSVGGVQDMLTATSRMDIPGQSKGLSWFNKHFDKYTEFASTISGVKAQDSFTKSVEFNYQMDKHLRLAFDIPYATFYTNPNVHKMMNTEKYARALVKSIDETEKALFGKSYKKRPGMLGDLARTVEDIRLVPGIGLTMPFGRFFNNTIAFMSDHTGVSLGAKFLGIQNMRDPMELATRAAIGWTAIGIWVAKDREDMKNGIPLTPITHLELPSGRVMDAAAEFPVAPLQAIARAVAYNLSDQEMSKEEAEEIFKSLSGQITRNMSESGKEAYRVAINIIQGNDQNSLRAAGDILGAVGAQVIQSATRWIDPINEAAGLLRGEKATVADRRQGVQVLSKGLRYLDQIVGLLGAEGGPEKYSASEGKVTRRPTSVLGSKDVTYTDTMKLMDYVGIPYYKLNSYSKSPEADNRYNQIFFDVFNDRAGRLIHRNVFLRGNKETRTYLYRDLIDQSKKDVYKMMEESMEVDDPRFKLILKISGSHGWQAVDKAMSSLESGASFEDLSLDSLELLDYWLTNQEDIKLKILEKK